ncbi:MAG TPA: hypothetical protein VLF60_01090 [Candidatus Saccharimonadales bacterium]|nr:hypothetical protein [Candidatus Saccharimonadales bacterium]
MIESTLAPAPSHPASVTSEAYDEKVTAYRKALEFHSLIEQDDLLGELNGDPRESLNQTLTRALLDAQQQKMPGVPPLTQKALENSGILGTTSPEKFGKHVSTSLIDTGLASESQALAAQLIEQWREGQFERIVTGRDAKGEEKWYYNAEPVVHFPPIEDWPLHRVLVKPAQNNQPPMYALFRVPTFSIAPRMVDGQPVPSGADHATILPAPFINVSRASNETLIEHYQVLQQHHAALQTAKAKALQPKPEVLPSHSEKPWKQRASRVLGMKAIK